MHRRIVEWSKTKLEIWDEIEICRRWNLSNILPIIQDFTLQRLVEWQGNWIDFGLLMWRNVDRWSRDSLETSPAYYWKKNMNFETNRLINLFCLREKNVAKRKNLTFMETSSVRKLNRRNNNSSADSWLHISHTL